MATIYEIESRRIVKRGNAVLFNRATKALNYAQQYLRYSLGLRGRPSSPAGLSDRTRLAARELVMSILEEE